MASWRLILAALLLCIAGVGCSGSEPAPAPDSGVTGDAGSDAGTGTVDAGSDAGTTPDDAGTDGGTAGPDGGTDGGTPGPNAVRVTRIIHDLTGEEVQHIPWVFPPDSLRLYVLEGESFVEVAGAPGAPGEYVFPNVPRVTYYLRDGLDWIITEARVLDLDRHSLVRDGIEYLEEASLVQLWLYNLEPWHGSQELPGGQPSPPPYSRLYLVSDQLRYRSALFGPFRIREGDTSTFGDGADTFMPRVEASLGDRMRLVQSSPRELGALPDGGVQRYLSAGRVRHLPPFSHDGSEPISISGELESLPMQEAWVDWRVSAFTALAAGVHPAATATSAGLSLRNASSEPIPEGWLSPQSELASVVMTQNELNDVFGTLVYGNPSPRYQGALTRASVNFSVPVEAPSGESFELTGTLFVQDRPSAFASAPILPRAHPPRALTVDGTEAYSPRTLAAGSHVVAWQPPSSGAPDAYLLRVQLIDLNNGSPFPFTFQRIFVSGSTTSLRLPPGGMPPGQLCALSVEAIVSEGYSGSKRPQWLDSRYIVSRAPTLSGLLNVPAQAP